jgi:hypothetical protein
VRTRGALLALALAAASLVLARALSYDAWGWLLWGREIAGALPFTTNGYPTWKPLTGLLAVPLAPLGDAGPLLWLLTARFGAAMSVVLAYRLGCRAAGRLAGVLAAVSLLLMPEWLFQAGLGGSEPLLTAMLLGAVDLHADRRDAAGFALVFLAGLLRPESWPLLLASGAVAWTRRPGIRQLVVAGLAAIPALWFGGDFIGSGDPLRGAQLAQMTREAQLLHRSAVPPFLGVLDHAWPMVPLPLLACAPPAIAHALRGRDPVLLPLAFGGLAWLGEVLVLAALGYAGIVRFLFPAAAALAVVGSAGVVLVLRSPTLVPALRTALVMALAALAVVSVPRVLDVRHQGATVERRMDLEQELGRLVARFGRRSFRAAPLSSEGVLTTSLAWRVGVATSPLAQLHMPGLRVATRDRRWRPFWRAVRRRRTRFQARTIGREGSVFLISIKRVRRRPCRAQAPALISSSSSGTTLSRC